MGAIETTVLMTQCFGVLLVCLVCVCVCVLVAHMRIKLRGCLGNGRRLCPLPPWWKDECLPSGTTWDRRENGVGRVSAEAQRFWRKLFSDPACRIQAAQGSAAHVSGTLNLTFLFLQNGGKGS